ncbi:hypothetical protein F0L68_34590 [Solihabitans fulvus]|uniref:Type I-C CRISPR-associated protein Cas8c/Csd1 n=1 Tax=Solihabitans fulvus TaxID=1892852 RepID=A0A5B2WKP9_9PSEU|nr:type I-C CRISPR-associated protein Cas8c/Csd1 [Solihabitans fulvus]KAA2252653.1 hypothetical protein F0L68_34590 [Solihabitans fulvus]
MLLHHLAEQGRLEASDGGPAHHADRTVLWQLHLSPDGTAHLISVGTARAGKAGKTVVEGVPHSIPDPGRTSGVAAGLGADTAEYVLGWPRLAPNTGAPVPDAKTAVRHEAFVALTQRWAQTTDPVVDPVPHALAAFFREGGPARLARPDGGSGSHYMVIYVDGEHAQFAHQSPTAASFWTQEIVRRKGKSASPDTVHTGLCLICRADKPVTNTIPGKIPARLVPGATQNVAITSVNDPAAGYDASTGLVHAPICFDCADAMVTGATTILSDPDHTLSAPGRSVTAWWTSTPHPDAEACMKVVNYTGSHPAAAVREILDSLWDGKPRGRAIDTARFTTATLSGNVSRLVLRDWLDLSVAQLVTHVRTWIATQAAGTAAGRAYPVWLLALACGRWTGAAYVPLGVKADNRLADLREALLRSALTGRPIPHKVISNLLVRIHRDHAIDGPRLALIALALHHHRKDRPVPSVDSPDQPAAYVAGRILALLGNIQAQASDYKVNRTYLARAMSGARTRPDAALAQGVTMARTAWLPKLARFKPAAATALHADLTALLTRLTDVPFAGPLSHTDHLLLVTGIGHQEEHIRQSIKARKQAKAADTSEDPQ